MKPLGQLEMLPKLYRGDSFVEPLPRPPRPPRAPWELGHKGKRFTEYNVTEGLMAKVADHGLSKDFNRELHELVIDHIGFESCMVCGEEKSRQKKSSTHECSNSQRASYHSPLISFTPRIERARQYMNENPTKIRRWAESDTEKPTHYLIEISGIIPSINPCPGVFGFVYQTSSAHSRNIIVKQDAKIAADALISSLLMQLIVLNHLDNDKTPHFAFLIDTHRYLLSKPDFIKAQFGDRFSLAIERAARDEEWLLMPADPMPDGIGFSAKFLPNEHLKIIEQWIHAPGKAITQPKKPPTKKKAKSSSGKNNAVG